MILANVYFCLYLSCEYYSWTTHCIVEVSTKSIVKVISEPEDCEWVVLSLYYYIETIVLYIQKTSDYYNQIFLLLR